ncbi:MAG: biotin/lipoyl-containing protein [Dehalococcoidia bacterium]
MSRVEVRVPKLGLTMTEAAVLELSKAVGDVVAASETIAVIETEKITAEVEAPVAGTIVAILAEEEETYPVGELLAVIEAEG